MSRVRDERGFSLVEVAVAGAVLMLLLLPLLRFFDSAVSGANELQSSTQLHADARFAVDRLARELRQAYTGTTTLAPVTVAPDRQSITFYSPDTSTPFRLRKIGYRLASGRLERSVTWSNQTSCPTTSTTTPTSCALYGPATWTFPADGPWVPVLAVRPSTGFTAVLDGTALARVDIDLVGTNSRARADRPVRTSVELRNR